MSVGELTEILAPWQPATYSNWEFTQVKYFYDVILGKMLQNTAQSIEDVQVPYLKAQHVQWNDVRIEDLPTMWASPWEIEFLRIRKGDLLVCEGGEVGRAAIVANQPPVRCIIQNALHLVRPKSSGNTHFLRYLLQHAVSHGWLDVLCNRATIAHFTVEKFEEMWIWVPPLPKQRAIAAYLDRKVADIDALITAKQRLLALLAEKRRALITHAVTRGLNPDAPLRESGVAWLGAVPEHWRIERLKNLIYGIDTDFSPQCYNFPAQQGEWGVLKTGCVNGGIFRPEENKTLPDDVEPPVELEVHAGDILMSRASGSIDLIGSVALIDKQLDVRLLLSDKTFRIRLNVHAHNANFFVASMGSFLIRQQILRSISGAEGLANNITQGDIREFILTVPPLEEQQRIAAFLQRETAKLDDLAVATERAIALLRERRVALIAAAVTGQIAVEVRDAA